MSIFCLWARLHYEQLAHTHRYPDSVAIGKLTIHLLVAVGISYHDDQHTLYDTGRRASLVFVKWCLMGCTMEKGTLHSFYSAVKLGLNSVDSWTLRITGFRF